MGRLTTIDDIERQRAAVDEEEMRAAQEAFSGSTSGAAHGEDPEPEEHAAPRTAEEAAQQVEEHNAAAQAREGKDAQAPQAAESTAQQELDFHGLDNLEKHSSGHVALIVIAVVIVIAAALKIAGVY